MLVTFHKLVVVIQLFRVAVVESKALNSNEIFVKVIYSKLLLVFPIAKLGHSVSFDIWKTPLPSALSLFTSSSSPSQVQSKT